jgi:hypothetical protein
MELVERSSEAPLAAQASGGAGLARDAV